MPHPRKAKASRAPRRPSLFNVEAALTALPPETRRQDPTLPVDTALLEAERLCQAALVLRSRLVRLPDFDPSYVDRIPVLIDALEKQERAWDRFRRAKKAGERKPLRVEAEDLRGQALVSGRYLFRRHKEGLQELNRIAEGEGLPDLIQDLKEVELHMDTYAARWALDTRLPENAGRRCGELARALEGGQDSEEAIAALERRNQLFVLLQQAMDEVREGARYLLGKDRKRLAPFLSQYEAERKRRQRRQKAADVQTPAVPQTVDA